MPRNAPTIMVSSTCYDLKQVRQDLSRFIEEMGYNPLLSEFDYFPIDPDLDTVENCRRRVEQDADIMVLIIGGRYGYVEPKSDKSITNLEYLTARAKGIPVYAFVDKGILPLLPMWERNPNADFGDTVPNTKVFEFIKQVRGKDSVWTIEFEHAQDIVQALRRQFAHQMLEGLNLRKQIRDNRNDIPNDISGQAIRIILERPSYWAHRLFAQVIDDETSKQENLYQEYRLNIVFGYEEAVDVKMIHEWTIRKLTETMRFLTVVADLINNHLPAALGGPGNVVNSKALIFVAKKIGALYKEAIEWALRVKRVYADEEFQPLIDHLAASVDYMLRSIREIKDHVDKQIDEILLEHGAAGNEYTLTLNISPPKFDDTSQVLAQCVQAHKSKSK